jgi:hypothetical protein
MLINPKPDSVQFSPPSLSKFMLINLKQLKNPVKLYKKKAPKKGRDKETRGKHQSPGKRIAQKKQATRRKGTTKYRNLHQLLEAYQLKKGEVNP